MLAIDRINARTAYNGSVRIEAEARGDPTDAPMLLIMGAMASMLWWPDELIEALVEAGRYVIRYDNRDTGLSTSFRPGRTNYGLDELVDDAFAVLEAYGIDKAHWVGMSLGGAIVQLAALRAPERCLSLALVSTTPLGMPGLPPPTSAVAAVMASAAAVDWSRRESAIDFVLRYREVLSGPSRPFDREAARAFVEHDYDRSSSFASVTNHARIARTLAQEAQRLTDIEVATVIVHGTDDPLYPMAHAEAAARAIAGARLVRLAGGGHGPHPNDWPALTEALVST